MRIRTYEPGDERQQAAIYNEAAGALPGFKPSSEYEVCRRTSAPDFDPATRFYAVQDGQLVGYCLFNANGRISYPWCRRGDERYASLLFDHALAAMQRRSFPLAFAAYREDWPSVTEFFEKRGFRKARKMINFAQPAIDTPTMPSRSGRFIEPVQRKDVPRILQLGNGVLRVASPQVLEKHLFDNPYFGPDSLLGIRGDSSELLAAGVLITDPSYADVNAVDPAMPCFRLGAFGTEHRNVKRIKGLFSFVAEDSKQFGALAMDLLTTASHRVQECDQIDTLAAQVPSDAPHLLRFYKAHFQRQGSFPVLEKPLA